MWIICLRYSDQIESLAGILVLMKPLKRRNPTTPPKTALWALAANEPA